MVYEFENFRLDTNKQQLTREDEKVKLTPKLRALLFVFVKNHQKDLSHDFLYEQMWTDPNNKPEDQNLHNLVSRLRNKLDASDKERFIKTLNKAYCFVADVKVINEDAQIIQPENFIAESKTEEQAIELITDDSEKNKKNYIRKYIPYIAIIIIMLIVSIIVFWVINPRNDEPTKTINTPDLTETPDKSTTCHIKIEVSSEPICDNFTKISVIGPMPKDSVPWIFIHKQNAPTGYWAHKLTPFKDRWEKSAADIGSDSNDYGTFEIYALVLDATEHNRVLTKVNDKQPELPEPPTVINETCSERANVVKLSPSECEKRKNK